MGSDNHWSLPALSGDVLDAFSPAFSSPGSSMINVVAAPSAFPPGLLDVALSNH